MFWFKSQQFGKDVFNLPQDMNSNLVTFKNESWSNTVGSWFRGEDVHWLFPCDFKHFGAMIFLCGFKRFWCSPLFWGDERCPENLQCLGSTRGIRIEGWYNWRRHLEDVKGFCNPASPNTQKNNQNIHYIELSQQHQNDIKWPHLFACFFLANGELKETTNMLETNHKATKLSRESEKWQSAQPQKV